jgi:hypothetical protein
MGRSQAQLARTARLLGKPTGSPYDLWWATMAAVRAKSIALPEGPEKDTFTEMLLAMQDEVERTAY